MDEHLKVNSNLEIPLSELSFTASRGGGPGGQHVNKTSSRVTLRFNVRDSATLSDRQRNRILHKLANRINHEGELRIHVSEERSQYANRQRATERLRLLLAAALRYEKPRRKTHVPQAQRRKRLDSKKKRGNLKQMRRKPHLTQE